MVNLQMYFDGLLTEIPADRVFNEVLKSTNGKTVVGNPLRIEQKSLIKKSFVNKIDGNTYLLDIQTYVGFNSANVEIVLPIETAVLTVQDVDNGKYAVKNSDNTYDVLCHTKTVCGNWSVRNKRAQSRHIASNVTPSEITKQNGVYYINDNEYYDVTYNGFMYNGVFVPIEDEYEIVYGDAVDSGVLLKQNGQFYDVYTQEMNVSGNTVVKGDVHYIERNIPYELHGEIVQIDGKDAQYYYIKYTDENGEVNWVNTGEYSFVGEDKRDYTHEEETEDPSTNFDQYTIKKIGDKYYAILYKSQDFATESDFDNYFNSHTLQNLSMCKFIELEPYKSNKLEYLEDGTTLVYFYYVKYLDKTLRTDRYEVYDVSLDTSEDPAKADYLTFVTRSPNATLSFTKNPNLNPNPQLEYAIGSSDWKEWDFSDITTTYNQVIYFRGNNQTLMGFYLKSSDKYEIKGCISTIFQNIPNPVVLSYSNLYALENFFSNMPNITRIADLILDVSGKYCYYETFANLKNIEETPEFSNISRLREYQFQRSFVNCTNLKIVKDLPNIHIPELCFDYCFQGCTSLELMPQIPSTDLSESCYRGMFKNSGIRTLTTLPARIVPDYAYYYMFSECQNLTDTIPLSCDSIGYMGCGYMYSDCDKIKQPNYISVKEVGADAFICMFERCSSLTTTAEIRDLKVASRGCFCYMYKHCGSLTEAHDINCEELLENSCFQMFAYCYALTIAPRLLTVVVGETAYDEMFYGCYDLSYIECAMVRDSSVFGDSWVSGVGSSGTFVKNVLQTKYEYSYNSIPTGWEIVNKNFSDETEREDPAKADYLTFVTKSPNATLSFSKDANHNPQLEYAIGSSDWKAWDFSDITTTYKQVIYFRGNNQTFNGCWFESQDKYEIKGCLSTIFQNSPSPVVLSEWNALRGFFRNMPNITRIADLILDVSGAYCYCETFSYLNNITETPRFTYDNFELPLGEYQFDSSFYGCTNLKIVNDLPNTNIPIGCFRQCFSHCSSLEQMPNMPSRDISKSCYYGMFEYSGIRTLTTLPARIVPDSAYSYMFSNCYNLTESISISCDRAYSYSFGYMFVSCKNIKYANPISVIDVNGYTFRSMFSDCTSLTTTAKIRNLSYASDYCFYSMYENCVSLTKAHDMRYNYFYEYSCKRMFANCTALTKAPRLLTIYWDETSCEEMFKGCNSLSYIECAMFSDSSVFGNGWVSGVASSGTFVKNELQTKYEYSDNSIPTGWEIVNKMLPESITLPIFTLFKTDVYPSKNITVEVCFKHNSSGERCLFGVSSGAENWQNDGKVFAVYISNNYLDAYVGKKYEQVAPCTQNEWHTVSLKWDSVVVDGVNYGNVWGNTDYSGYTENIHIGSRNTSTYVWEGDASEFTYKYIKIYDNDTLIKDIIPMVQRDGGFPCIYNKVNGEFTFSKGREPIINW